MVVRAEQSTAREVQDAMTRLRTAGVDAPLKGTIFNGVRRFRVGYGASYRYYDSYKEGVNVMHRWRRLRGLPGGFELRRAGVFCQPVLLVECSYTSRRVGGAV